MSKSRYLFLLTFIIFSTGIFAQEMFYSRLGGEFVIPAVTTTASGTAWFLLDAEHSTLSYNITYAKLSSAFTAAHLHMGFSDQNGPVIFPITFTGTHAEGTWTNVPDSIIGKIMKEGIYVNIHSANYPDGEIRGQLYVPRGVGYTAAINGNQQVPPNASTNVGTGYAILESGSRIHYSITISGVTDTLKTVSLNDAPAGNVGSSFRTITLTDLSNRTFWNLVPDSALLALFRGNAYFNINSSAFPNGELRGQLVRQGDVYFTLSLSGAEETPPVVTNAKATGWMIMRDDMQSLQYNISYANLSSAYTGSHIHLGDSGVSGPAIIPVPFDSINTAAGILNGIADTTILRMLKGQTYFNIHSVNFSAGEIRGQVKYIWGTPLVAKFGGEQEVPPVSTPAKGTGWFIYTNERLVNDTLSTRRLYYRITVHNLSSAITSASFRIGAPGISGGLIAPITFNDSTVDSWYGSVSDVFLANALRGHTYVNIYTANNPTGEIRGQLKYTKTLSVPVEVSEINVSSTGNRVELNWTTATETNNYGFDVERSKDNFNFVKIGFVPGNGTSTEFRNYQFVDDGLETGKYYYRIKQMDYDGSVTYSRIFEIYVGVPQIYQLSQNYPNPFNPTTTISFMLPVRDKVTLKIYNVLGSEVGVLMNEEKDAGSYIINFDAKNLASGVYFYELRTSSGVSLTKKMNLIK